ncbi:DUF4249 domain-containing protein [Bacteroidota bacterium]
MLVTATLLISSCEEVIEIDLNSVHPALVVEGFLYKDQVARVHLSETANYFSLDHPVPIENATVILTSNGIESEELVNLGDGNYMGVVITGTEGVNYDLEIMWEEEVYSGSAYLPMKPEILSLDLIEFQPAPQAPLFTQISSTFLDGSAMEDYFYIKYFQNDTLLRDFYFAIPDQIAIQDTIEFTNPIHSFLPGDVIEVQVYAIDEPLFNYFSQLNDALGGSMAMSSTPYNPTSNIEGAMGYFAAWSYDADTVSVPIPGF